jgi:putative flippase GtrA
MKNLKLFMGYTVCAGIATVVDVGILYILSEKIGMWYFYAALISYLAGMMTNFSLNREFNFKNKTKKIPHQFSLFATVALVGLVLNQMILTLLVEKYQLWVVYAKGIAVLVVMLWSFYGHKKITFSNDPNLLSHSK